MTIIIWPIERSNGGIKAHSWTKAGDWRAYAMKQLFVFSLCILLSILPEFCFGTQKNNRKKENYRLTTDIIPLEYILDLTPYFDQSVNGKKPFTLEGVCTITIQTNKSNVNAITLHKQYIDIIEQSLTTAPKPNATHQRLVETIGIKSNEYNNVTHKYTLKLAASLVKDKPYVLKFKYTGQLRSDLRGLFYISYQVGNATK